MAYLCGIETVEYKVGQRPVVEVKTAVVGIEGTAPDSKIPPKTLTVFAGEEDAKNKLGDPLDGFTVWKALKAIFDHENTTVLFVNAFDPNVHVDANGNPLHEPYGILVEDVDTAQNTLGKILVFGVVYRDAINVNGSAPSADDEKALRNLNIYVVDRT